MVGLVPSEHEHLFDLCVLLLEESDMWWYLKVSPVRFVFRLTALLEYSTCDLTHVCL